MKLILTLATAGMILAGIGYCSGEGFDPEVRPRAVCSGRLAL